MDQTRFNELVYGAVAQYLAQANEIPVGVSNRHVHLSRADMEVLFGKDAALRIKKELGQPGQYAAEETVNLIGAGGRIIKNVRVLGPLRPESQVEISLTDSFLLGIKAPVRESGDLTDTHGLVLEGSAGSVTLSRGVIVAWRHIHLSEERARQLNLRDKELVSVETDGPRGCVLKNVLVRVSKQFAPEMHIDTDEANACGLKNGDTITIRKN